MNFRQFVNLKETLDHVAGMNILIRDDDSLEISIVTLGKKNNSFSIGKMVVVESLDTAINELKTFVPRHSRLHVNIQGKGILAKPLDVKTNGDENAVLTTAFPWAKEDQFYLQVYRGLAVSYATIARATVVDGWLPLMADFSLSTISFGWDILSAAIPLLTQKDLQIRNAQLKFDGKYISEITVLQKSEPDHVVQLTGGQIPTQFLAAYCASLFIVFGAEGLVPYSGVSMKKSQRAFDFYRRLHVFSKRVGVTVLILLVINLFVYLNFAQETNELASLQSQHNELGSKRAEAKTNYKKAVTRHTTMGWRNNILPLHYADQIGGVMLHGVRLKKLSIGLQESKTTSRNIPAIFDNKRIKISGTADSQLVMNDQLRSLRELEWVESIERYKYSLDSKAVTGWFELDLIIK